MVHLRQGSIGENDDYVSNSKALPDSIVTKIYGGTRPKNNV